MDQGGQRKEPMLVLPKGERLQRSWHDEIFTIPFEIRHISNAEEGVNYTTATVGDPSVCARTRISMIKEVSGGIGFFVDLDRVFFGCNCAAVFFHLTVWGARAHGPTNKGGRTWSSVSPSSAISSTSSPSTGPAPSWWRCANALQIGCPANTNHGVDWHSLGRRVVLLTCSQRATSNPGSQSSWPDGRWAALVSRGQTLQQ